MFKTEYLRIPNKYLINKLQLMEFPKSYWLSWIFQALTSCSSSASPPLPAVGWWSEIWWNIGLRSKLIISCATSRGMLSGLCSSTFLRPYPILIQSEIQFKRNIGSEDMTEPCGSCERDMRRDHGVVRTWRKAEVNQIEILLCLTIHKMVQQYFKR